MLFSLYTIFEDSDINQIEPKLFVLLGTNLSLFDSHGVYEQVINNKIINYIGCLLFQYTIPSTIIQFLGYIVKTFESLNNLDVYLLIFLSIILVLS